MTTEGGGQWDVSLSGCRLNDQHSSGGGVRYLDFAACRGGPAFLVSVQVFWEQRSDEVADGRKQTL